MDFTETECVGQLFSEPEMRVVNRVERAAQYPYGIRRAAPGER
jgi:hypothetical protein